jgi:hypothetical protein
VKEISESLGDIDDLGSLQGAFNALDECVCDNEFEYPNLSWSFLGTAALSNLLNSLIDYYESRISVRGCCVITNDVC